MAAADDQLLELVRRLENSGDSAVSPAGAVGRYQIMPNTARQFGFDPARLKDPVYNEKVARAILGDLSKRYNGDTQAILIGYNAGPGRADSWIARGRDTNRLPAETQRYLDRAAKYSPMVPVEGPVHVAPKSAENPPPTPRPEGQGQNRIQAMIDAGAPADEVQKWKQQKTLEWSAAGAPADEIAKYFGDGEPDTTNLQRLAAHDVNAMPQERKSQSLFEDVMGGWQHSAVGLTFGAPNLTPRDGSLLSGVASGLSQTVGDLPLMIPGAAAGAIAGAGAGGAVAGPEGAAIGGVAGGGAGAFAAPEAYRGIMLDHYRKGDITSWGDFWSRYSGILYDTGKAALIGAISAPIGGKAGATVLKATGSRMLASGAEGVAFSAAATTTGATLDGHQPDAHDFAAAVVTLLGVKAGAKVVGATGRYVLTPKGEKIKEHMEDIYEKTGVPPWEQAKRAGEDKEFAADLQGRTVDNDPITTTWRQVAPAEADPYQAQQIKSQVDQTLGAVQQAQSQIAQATGEAPILKNPAPSETPSKLNLDVVSGKAHADEVAAMELAAGGGKGGKPPGPPGAAGAGGEEPIEGQFREIPSYTADTIRDSALGMIAGKPTKPLVQSMKDFFSRLYDENVSELGPAIRMDQELAKKLTSYDPQTQISLEDQFRSTYASPERAGHAIYSGGIDPITLDRVSNDSIKGAFELAKKGGGSQEGFIAWMLARRLIEKAGQGIDTGLLKDLKGSLEDRVKLAQKLVDADKGKYTEALGMWRRANDQKLDYAVESGLYSREQAEAWKKNNRDWISHKRELEDAGYVGPGYQRSKGPRKVVQEMKGSDQMLHAPVDATIDSFHAIIGSADRNRAVGSIVGAAEFRDALGVKLIETSRKETIYDKDGKIVQETPEQSLIANEKLNGKIGPEDFVYYNKGQREVWRVPGRPDVAAMIRGAQPTDASLVTAFARYFARTQRSGIVRLPDYIARNLMRDAFSSAVLDKYSGPPLVGTLHAVMDVHGQGEAWWDFVRNGGMGSALNEMDKNYIQNDIDKVFRETNTWNSIVNTVLHPFQASAMLMTQSDAIRRAATYRRNVAAGAPKLKAGMRSRQTSLDFVESGTSILMRWWSGVTPFLRPSLLGFNQLMRSVQNDPMGVVTRGAAYITTVSMGLYYLNWMNDQNKDADDPTRYENLPRWQRDTMWILPDYNGVHIRIPKPPVIGLVFGSLPERMLDGLKGDEEAFKNWGNTFMAQFIPSIIPAITLPILENWGNKSVYLDRPLIPSVLEDLSGYMQYTPYTTETAKKLSQFAHGLGVDVSPIIIDNYARGWYGNIGIDFFRAAGAPFSENIRPWELADTPMIGSFIARDETMSAAPVQDFYDHLKKFKTAHADFEMAVNRGNEQEINTSVQDQRAFVSLDTMSHAMKVQAAAIQTIDQDKEMTVDEKRQQETELWTGVIATAKGGLEMMRAIEAANAPQEQPVPAEPVQ